jgi:multiple sugar transport system ATP-binding protein
MAEIKIKNDCKSFEKHEALKSINLIIKDKEFMVLLGASGCGKTTLLRIIAGLETPTSGEVWIGDERVDHLPPRERGIAMVFQNYAVFPHLTVFDNISFGLLMHKIDKETLRYRVNDISKLLGIEKLFKRYSGELSGGQRQRVALARALVMQPKVILMDEPLSNLDAILRLDMRAELKGILNQSSTTTIYVTHDQVEAMSLADRISVINNGIVVQVDYPAEIYHNPIEKYVASFVGNPPMNFLKAASENGKWRVSSSLLDGPQVNSGLEFLEMGIRPENVSLSSSGIPALVKVVESLGPHILATCDIGGTLFRTVLENDSDINQGDQIFLKFRTDKIRWFNPKNGLSLN